MSTYTVHNSCVHALNRTMDSVWQGDYTMENIA